VDFKRDLFLILLSPRRSLLIASALYLDDFEQPENLGLDWEPFAGRTIVEAEAPSLKKK
jgi:hypothetical protein